MSKNNFLNSDTEYQKLPKNGTDGIIILCLSNYTRTPRRIYMNTKPQFIKSPKNMQLGLGDELKLYCR